MIFQLFLGAVLWTAGLDWRQVTNKKTVIDIPMQLELIKARGTTCLENLLGEIRRNRQTKKKKEKRKNLEKLFIALGRRILLM